MIFYWFVIGNIDALGTALDPFVTCLMKLCFHYCKMLDLFCVVIKNITYIFPFLYSTPCILCEVHFKSNTESVL
jgi:uncharacterized membrane-anchored protein